MEDILAVLFIFGGGSIFLFAVSPVGRAIADRIRGGGARSGDKTLEKLKDSQVAVLEELDGLRQDVSELQERLDFTERVLAQHREAERLPRSGERNQ